MMNGQSICIVKCLTGHDCPGCGIARAVWSVLHFKFIQAWNFNHLIIVVFPLLVYVWCKTVYKLANFKILNK